MIGYLRQDLIYRVNAFIYLSISSDFLTMLIIRVIDSVGGLCALVGGEINAAWKDLE